MERYKVIGHISAGAHGVILKAKLLTANGADERDQLVAVKRIFIRSQHKQIPLTLIREIKSLQLLDGENFVIPLLDVCALGSSVNLIFPLLPVNLTALIYEFDLTDYQKQCYSLMILKAIEYCHLNDIVHRDLKPSNMLIDWDGTLRVCDFGQARLLASILKEDNNENDTEEGLLSHQVCTLWYRAPELLYGSNKYSFDVDLWSVGCIIAELSQMRPLFKGDSDIEQLCIVIKSLGAPDEKWARHMPDYNKISFTIDKIDQGTSWHSFVNECQNKMLVDLVKNMCCYQNRWSATQCMQNAYFGSITKYNINYSLLPKPSHIKQVSGPPVVV